MARDGVDAREAHPFLHLLADAKVRTLWGGLVLSDIGSELYRLGAIWLAVGMAGADAAWLPVAQAGAQLAVALGAGAVIDGLSARKVMIWSDLIRAAVTAAAVTAAFTIGLSLPLLIGAGVVLSGLTSVFDPALNASLPRLAPDPHRLRAVNGLFDVTGRLAMMLGSVIAAGLAAIAPPIHLLTANAASFLASAGAVAAVGHRLDGEAPAAPSPSTVLQRVARGARAVSSIPGGWTVMHVTGVSFMTRTLAIALALPLMLSKGDVAGGLSGLALVTGAVAVSDGLTNVVTTPWRVQDPWRFLFAGYVLRGLGVAGVGAAALLLPKTVAPFAMAASGAVYGAGGSVAFLQILPFFQTRLSADDVAAVFRLRYAIMAGATMAGALLAPAVLRLASPAWVIVVCGVVLAVAGVYGRQAKPRLTPADAPPHRR